MTLTQRLQILASTQRSRLAELAGLDELTPELRAELDTLGATHQDTESQLRAAIAADDAATPPGDPVFDSEARERLELRAKTGIGDFLTAAATGAAVTGAAAEYAAACGVPVVGHLPMAIFARARSRGAGHHAGACREGRTATDRPVRVRAVGGGEPRDHDAVSPIRPGTDTKDHHRAPGRHAGEGRRGSGDGCGGHAGQSGASPHRGQFRGPGGGLWP